MEQSKQFLTETQISKLKLHGWDAKPKGSYVDLYQEDFSSDVWEELCNNFGILSESKSATILYFGVK